MAVWASAMDKDQSFEEYFAILQRHHLYSGRRASLKFYLDYLFQGLSFEGRAMLDIGGGTGLFSLYGACCGAKPVVCLEPELEGSTEDVSHRLKRLCDSVSPQIDISPVGLTFQDFHPGGQTFDIILLHNSINHLDEEACIALQHSADARQRYGTVFQKLSALATPGAKLVIADCSRYNFWDRIGLRNPLAPTIEWHKHQSPRYWAELLYDFGFVNPEIRWASLAILGPAGRLFLGNRLASYFTTSHFCLVMDRA